MTVSELYAFSLKDIHKVLKEVNDNAAFPKALQEMQTSKKDIQDKMKTIEREIRQSLTSALFNKPLRF